MRGRGQVLVVDDEEDVRETIADVLMAKGYAVTTVADGDAALESIRHSPVDLVTLDLRMPGMDSKEALVELRRVSPNSPVVVVSGYVSGEEADACIALGAFAVVRKPFELEELLAVLERARRASER